LFLSLVTTHHDINTKTLLSEDPHAIMKMKTITKE
jgi:hypothetical protein